MQGMQRATGFYLVAAEDLLAQSERTAVLTKDAHITASGLGASGARSTL